MSNDRRRLENQATFRAANEKQRRRAGVLADVGDPVPFLCECADPRCTQVLLLTLAAYGEMRSAGPRRFVIAPDHEVVEGEVVVAARERFWITEKPESAEEQDAAVPRAQPGS